MCSCGRGFFLAARAGDGSRDLQGKLEFGGKLVFDVGVALGGLYVMAEACTCSTWSSSVFLMPAVQPGPVADLAATNPSMIDLHISNACEPRWRLRLFDVLMVVFADAGMPASIVVRWLR